jgi:hypothetical protein
VGCFECTAIEHAGTFHTLLLTWFARAFAYPLILLYAQVATQLPNGAELLAINGSPTSQLSLPAIHQLMSISASRPRNLRVAMPPAEDFLESVM